jgi:hypothetical protein
VNTLYKGRKSGVWSAAHCPLRGVPVTNSG